MAVNKEKYFSIIEELKAGNATLVAVSKTKPVGDILELYKLGQRDFGENYVQELVEKQEQLPKDIHWHFIGHLQSNKVKFIAPFVYLIHGVDSYKLLKEVNKQAEKLNKVIDVLLQIHIAKEETKFGLDEKELAEILNSNELQSLKNICIKGLMGMASFTDDEASIKKEFQYLKNLYEQYIQLPRLLDLVGQETSNIKFQTLSLGMSSDYQIAMQQGSNMVRIGSLLFGQRNKP
jgi:pyridoxal phosphate enzyme (YggS family)